EFHHITTDHRWGGPYSNTFTARERRPIPTLVGEPDARTGLDVGQCHDAEQIGTAALERVEGDITSAEVRHLAAEVDVLASSIRAGEAECSSDLREGTRVVTHMDISGCDTTTGTIQHNG